LPLSTGPIPHSTRRAVNGSPARSDASGAPRPVLWPPLAIATLWTRPRTAGTVDGTGEPIPADGRPGTLAGRSVTLRVTIGPADGTLTRLSVVRCQDVRGQAAVSADPGVRSRMSRRRRPGLDVIGRPTPAVRSGRELGPKRPDADVMATATSSSRHASWSMTSAPGRPCQDRPARSSWSRPRRPDRNVMTPGSRRGGRDGGVRTIRAGGGRGDSLLSKNGQGIFDFQFQSGRFSDSTISIQTWSYQDRQPAGDSAHSKGFSPVFTSFSDSLRNPLTDGIPWCTIAVHPRGDTPDGPDDPRNLPCPCRGHG
jgi:hypothetical protein